MREAVVQCRSSWEAHPRVQPVTWFKSLKARKGVFDTLGDFVGSLLNPLADLAMYLAAFTAVIDPRIDIY